MESQRKHRQDYWLSLTVFTLVAFGLIMIYSVSKYYSLQVTDEVSDKYYLMKQLMWAVLGFFAWIFFQSIDYRYWQKQSSNMFFATIFLLILPIFFGGDERHWVNLGFTQFQPSEIGKLAFTIYLAGWFAGKGENLSGLRQSFWSFLCVMGAVSFLMLIQGDLGTLIIYFLIGVVMFVGAGFASTQIIAGAALAGFLGWLAVKIEPYRLQRILTFLNPENNILGSGYHIRNALIAIGSGGVWGLGFGQSRQKYLYLPEAHTDSIFAIISEELGFVRASLIIVALAFITIRGYKIASGAPDIFSRLVAIGITSWIGGQALINLGAMLSIMPLTGIPLPFVSYGGTSLLILLAAVGLLVNISKYSETRMAKE